MTLLDRLAERLRTLPRAVSESSPIAVALSGGIDSVTLLAAVHAIGLSRGLRCIHINHQLHSQADDWARFCCDLAERLGIEIACRKVRCEPRGQGLEAAARDARYAALASELRESEILLTAHHGDDQLETLLYRLMRGTGVDGLRGIRGFESFGRGYLARPLLTESRAAIADQARAMGLQWCEDPSNENARFDRNFLRQAVVPALLERWPRAGAAAARFADAAEDAAELAGALALADLDGVSALDCLPAARLARLSGARQRNVLRFALRSLQLPVPDAAALQRICGLLDEPAQAAVVEWPGGAARMHRASLYLCGARAPVGVGEFDLSLLRACEIADGRLLLERAPAPALPDAWVREGLRVRFRRGGEEFQPAGRQRPTALREWMRTQDLLPWMRDRVPLIYRGQDLVAVADLCVSESAIAAGGDAGGWRIAWQDRPRIS